MARRSIDDITRRVLDALPQGLADAESDLRHNLRARRFYERSGWSCGVGDEMVFGTWSGPVMPDSPELEPPLPELQYRIVL